jgi:hypothetical protein
LYYSGKGYRVIELYFNRTEGNAEQCPFLIDEDNVMKIRKPKKSSLPNAEPPGLQELADEIGLNLRKKWFQTNLATLLWISI